MKTSRPVTALPLGILTAALLHGCSASGPTTTLPSETEQGGASGGNGTARAAASLAVDGNRPPQLVARVKPAPGADNVIVGTSPLELDVNLCRSVDPDEDPILFTIDADGDGTLDEAGTHGGNCRRTFTYTAEAGQVRELSPIVCVVDVDAAGKPRHDADCRTYSLRVSGPATEPSAPVCAPAPGFIFNGATRAITWSPVEGASSYNLYVKTVPNCERLSYISATLDDEKLANVQSPFDVSSFDTCSTCYYVMITSVTDTCESGPGGSVGFMLNPCRPQ